MKNKKTHMKRMLMLSLLTGACCFHSYATANEPVLMKGTESVESILQNKRISGVVNDNFGPVIGANVSIKGTSIGAITDMDGKFSFDAPEDGTLVISFVGYVTQEISIKGKSSFTINLKEDTEMLDEVVVTALGIKREKKALGYACKK